MYIYCLMTVVLVENSCYAILYIRLVTWFKHKDVIECAVIMLAKWKTLCETIFIPCVNLVFYIDLVPGSCEPSNEPLGSIKCIKKDFAPWIELLI